jgi:hypothetical protein
MPAFSIPSYFADLVPELTNLDISSVFAVIYLARFLVILAKE